MKKTNEELLAELAELQQKYEALEKKHEEETARFRKTEEELKMRLMFLEGIANSTIDGFLVVNPYGQKILQNQRTIELWKIPEHIVEDPSGLKQVEHVMHMTVNPQQFISEINYLREHQNDKSRDELALIDGTILDRYSSPVIGPDGKNYGRIWTFHDVTERKRTENQLIQLNADKDRFISILAHDLRNPFSNLLGFSELLLRNMEIYNIEKSKAMVDSIYTMAKKAYLLLEDTLLWANLKTKNIIYNPCDVDLKEIIAEVASILEPGANVKNISINYQTDDHLQVFADIYMMKAILRNLVSNAIKFSNEGDKIEIHASHNQSQTTIEIWDNGVGISPDVMNKLFNISTIQSTVGTANEVGTGLGLMLCKEFIEKHGGKIRIDSKINSGTKVIFNIPDKNSVV